MNDADDFDPRLAARLSGFADESLATFDAERVAAVAMAPKRRPAWQLAATAAAAFLLMTVAVVVAGSLSDRRSAGTSPLPSFSGPVGFPSPSISSPTVQSSRMPTSTGLTQEEAVAIARAAAPQSADRSVVAAEAGPSGEVVSQIYDFAAAIPSDRWVWVINLASGSGFEAEGSIVVIDFLDGHVYGVFDWIS